MCHWLRGLLILACLCGALGAAASSRVPVHQWEILAPGPLELGKTWRTYPFFEKPVFSVPPAIVEDDGRRALRLTTQAEAMRVGRSIRVELRRKPWLVWEWKPLVLPDGGDVRDRKRNDQAARIMIVFEGMRAIAYVWDTTAPVGTEVQPDELEMFQRLFVVVRSGPAGVGQWDRQRRNVYEDFRRAFQQEPRAVNWIGFETHSNDTRTRSSALFGAAWLEEK